MKCSHKGCKSWATGMVANKYATITKDDVKHHAKTLNGKRLLGQVHVQSVVLGWDFVCNKHR